MGVEQDPRKVASIAASEEPASTGPASPDGLTHPAQVESEALAVDAGPFHGEIRAADQSHALLAELPDEALGVLVVREGQPPAFVTREQWIARLQGRFAGLDDVDPARVVDTVLRGLGDEAPAREIDKLFIQTCSALVPEEPAYSFAAARLLHDVIEAEVRGVGVTCFSDSIELGQREGLIGDKEAAFVARHRAKLNAAIDRSRSERFGYFGLQTVYDRYLLRHPTRRTVTETPQYFLLRVAVGLSETPEEAIAFYELMSRLEYLPSSPTLFNAATRHQQMSSCYLLESPEDTLDGIYKRYMDIARLSKFAGGIGVAWHRVRSRGSLIRGTNGLSRGIVPFLKTLDSSVAAVNQGGRRKGAACVYLETWHGDIEEFLDLRENTGDEARRTHNLNLANWVPDLFMKRVEQDGVWSLFDPKVAPELVDLYGAPFEARYEQLEAEGKFDRQLPARELYKKMMRALAQTGNGWMTFKDACNLKCNQTGRQGYTVHSSNLCTEIVEVTNEGETAVCNLGSINVGRFCDDEGVDFVRLQMAVRLAVKHLDRVIDRNYYPIDESRASNARWRPVGLGLMGLQDVFFKLKVPFDDPRARELSTRISECIYYTALETSCDLAQQHGPHEAFRQTRAAMGELQFDSWGVTPTDTARWDRLRDRIMRHGLRNSLLIAIAPTATIASISGCYECIEPMVSNLFKRETLSGDFLQINTYLVADLKRLGLWTAEVREAIKEGNGSIQHIASIPAPIRHLYRTAWELKQRHLIDMAAERGAYIDQSQSLNLFMESPSIDKLSAMYLYAWKRGIKTTYYLRSRPATRIAQTSTRRRATGERKQFTPDEALACSLENPEYCEACQ
jgi:ribonucleoside-diphosphate reductase alpha chain